jgi:hypothetical protein
LSADDFPTELKVAIKLEYGRQRDSSDIQSMFNAGGGRIYYPYYDMDTNASSTFYNTEYIFNDKPSENKGAYQAVTGVKSANTGGVDLGTEKTSKLEPKVDKTQVHRPIYKYQNQDQVEKDGGTKK